MSKAPKKTKKAKGGFGKDGARVGRRPPARPPAEVRAELSIMAGLALFACSLVLVFVQHSLLPYLAGQEAIKAVQTFRSPEPENRGRSEEEILQRFREAMGPKGVRFLGWSTQVFPELTQVTYVYRDPESGDRRAFWWVHYPETGEVQRIRSIADFVDGHLLPRVKQIHEDVTGAPGPLALERHQAETY